MLAKRRTDTAAGVKDANERPWAAGWLAQSWQGDQAEGGHSQKGSHRRTRYPHWKPFSDKILGQDQGFPEVCGLMLLKQLARVPAVPQRRR